MIFIGFIYILFKVFRVAQGVLSLATRGYFAVKAVTLLSPSPPVPFPQALFLSLLFFFFFQAILSYHTHHFRLRRTHTYQKPCTLLFGALGDKWKFKSKENQLTSSTLSLETLRTVSVSLVLMVWDVFPCDSHAHRTSTLQIKKTRYKVAATLLPYDPK